MVLYDFSEQLEQKKEFRFAPPHQRIIASFVDFLLLYPSCFLLVSPLVRKIKEEFLYGTPYALGVSAVSSFLFVNIFVLLALTFSFAVFQSTPGQRLFGLRVRSFHGTRISFGQAFQRSFGWILSILLLGLPLLEVLTHRFRLVFYERMSETYVETLEKKWLIMPPMEFETQFGKWLIGTTFALAMMTGIATWRGWIESQMQTALLVATEQGELCDSLNPENIDREKRLHLALVLAFADSEKSSCLDQEYAGFWFKNTSTTKKITESPEMQLSLHHFMRFKEMKYSDYANLCDEENQVCLLLQYLELRKNEKSKDVSLSRDQLVEKLRRTENRIPLAEWIILQEDIKAQRFLAALSRLNELEKYVENESDELTFELENQFIRLAWMAQESSLLTEIEKRNLSFRRPTSKESLGKSAQAREPASIRVDDGLSQPASSSGEEAKSAQRTSLSSEFVSNSNSETKTVIKAFKERFGID